MRRASPQVVLAVFLASLFAAAPVVGEVTVVNGSAFPWLVVGTYADYRSTSLFEPPYFVTTNGTLLLGSGGPLPQGHVWLNWTVTSRTGDMVGLNIGYHAYGCDYSEQQEENVEDCTPYDFATATGVVINLTTNEAYVDGQPQGIVNLWEPPLTSGGTLNLGTAFVGAKPYTVVGNASAAVEYASVGGTYEVNDSGTMKGPPFYAYLITGITFGTGRNSTFGWEKSYAEGPESVFYLDPSGAYDYYNGLAYFFSIPDYPINQTVCDTSSGQPLNCQYTSYSTALGNFFRSGLGELSLVSTDVPLGPSQSATSTASPGGIPEFPNQFLAIAAVTLILGSYLLLRRRASL